MKIPFSILNFVAALFLTAVLATAQGISTPAPLGAELTRKFPFSMAGQLIFKNGASYYEGTGTVVYQRSVLTAAHNLWSPEAGWSTDMRFNRARNGASAASRQSANRLFVFGSYRNAAAQYGQESVRAFANDLGGLRFNGMPASGMYAGWRADTTLLTAGRTSIGLGYGAETHSGDELLIVRSSTPFNPILGAFLENFSLTFEAGMSGGPVLVEVAPNEFRIVGVVVAGSEKPPAGAIRAIDAAGAAFINTYLRY